MNKVLQNWQLTTDKNLEFENFISSQINLRDSVSRKIVKNTSVHSLHWSME